MARTSLPSERSDFKFFLMLHQCHSFLLSRESGVSGPSCIAMYLTDLHLPVFLGPCAHTANKHSTLSRRLKLLTLMEHEKKSQSHYVHTEEKCSPNGVPFPLPSNIASSWKTTTLGKKGNPSRPFFVLNLLPTSSAFTWSVVLSCSLCHALTFQSNEVKRCEISSERENNLHSFIPSLPHLPFLPRSFSIVHFRFRGEAACSRPLFF